MKTNLIDCHGLSYRTQTGRTLLRNVSFQVPKGQIVTLLGENGAGKTTLLDGLQGLWQLKEGHCKVLGDNCDQDLPMRRQRLGVISEKIDLPGDWSVQNVLDFYRPFYPKYDLAEQDRLLDLFELENPWRIGNLSTGQSKRLQIVIELAKKPELVLVDEITAVLDILARTRFHRLMTDYKERYQTTFFIATNILEDIENYSDRYLLLHQGELIEDCEITPDQKSIAQSIYQRLEQLC